ncbi:zf-TFIIB domain-containing protein [Microbacterium sp. NPDC076895]|uniref:TFIIB-type zinc ribbon-containing protein n=1 Tax=unclassified Microbacterium TaxID=2609290 RepID=UPI002ABBF328|nr:zf-TFIIB domain-containing protein [Dietzia sp.]
MKCPVDDTLLLVSERAGVEIDYCPGCRGVWLDRGELDKILDRATDTRAPRYPEPGTRDVRHDRGDSHQGRNGRRRRDGLLGELFDF